MPANQPHSFSSLPLKSGFQSALLLAALGLLGGCENHKVVNIQSVPPGASLRITKLMYGSPAGDIVPAPADPKTAITSQDLPFPAQALPTYQVTANLERFRENSIIIAWDLQKDYQIPLLEYKRPIDSIEFDPAQAGRVWNLAPRVTQEMAYLQKLIEPTTLVTNQTQVTLSHDDTTTDYLNLAASPIADLLIYQKVQKRTDGGYDSRLYKRNTKSGLETELTSTHAQEYTPAFTYGGDAVVFSSDNASDNPTLWQFPLNSGGSYIKYLTRTDAADYAPSIGQSLMVYSSLPPRCLARRSGAAAWMAEMQGTSPRELRRKSPRMNGRFCSSEKARGISTSSG